MFGDLRKNVFPPEKWRQILTRRPDQKFHSDEYRQQEPNDRVEGFHGVRRLRGDDVQQREGYHCDRHGEDAECEHGGVLSVSGFCFEAPECPNAVPLKLAFHFIGRAGTRERRTRCLAAVLGSSRYSDAR